MARSTSRTAFRSYSTRALESWFASLPPEWENLFNTVDLSKGRQIYTNGHIKKIELNLLTAELVAKIDSIIYRVVIEIRDGILEWRTSMPEGENAYPFIAASIYEIEELVADEITAIEEESAIVANTTPCIQEPKDTSSRLLLELQLQVHFNLTFTGIYISTSWLDSNGNARNCFGPDAIPSNELSNEQRQVLFRFNKCAHSASFVYNKIKGTWVIENIERIKNFVREELAEWRQRFKLVGDDALSIFYNPQLQAVVEAEVETLKNPKCFGLKWNLTVGGNQLKSDEEKHVLKSGGRPVILPNTGVVFYNSAVKDFLDDWEHRKGKIERYRLFSLFDYVAVSKLKLNNEVCLWKEMVLKEPAVYESLPSHLRPYQIKGVSWLIRQCEQGLHPLLADEMGLGKTIQVLALLAFCSSKEKSIIVCPASVIPVWISEIKRFHPAMFADIALLSSENNFVKNSEPKVWIASYTQLRLHSELLHNTQFSYAILDEAQVIKNPDAKISQVCLNIKANSRIAITGTPLENCATDIWTIFRFLMPGLLGKRASFEKQFLVDTPSFLAKLRRQVSPFILRRLKSDVAPDIPPKMEVILPCPLTKEQRAIYQHLTRGSGLVGDLGVLLSKNATSVLTLLMRLRQVCCDPGLLPENSHCSTIHSGKLTMLVSKLAEIAANGSKAVVFSQFVSLIERIKIALSNELPSLPIFELTGETKDRSAPVDKFKETKGPGVFLASLKAGGTGITLNSAEYVFLMDPWWNPAVESQAIDRVHRIGQKNRVLIYRMIAPGTLEERIEDLKKGKRELFYNIIGEIPDMSDWKQHFSSLDALVGLSDLPEDSVSAE